MAIRGDLALSTFEGRLRLYTEPTSGLGDMELQEVTAPGTPATNRLRLYAKDQSGTSALFYKNDAGTEINLSGSLTGTGVANRLAFWSGTSVLSSDADLTFLTDTLTATKLSVPTNIALTGTGTLNIAAMTQGSVPFFGTAGLLSQDNANLFWDDTNNDLLLGAAVQPWNSLLGRGIGVSRSGTAEFITYGHGAGISTIFRGAVSRGTTTTPTAAQTGDGTQLVLSPFGSAYGSTASIRMECAEIQSATAHGSHLMLWTTALGNNSVAERFRVGPSGQWGIGGATYGTDGNLFKSGGASAATSWQDHTADFLSQYALLAGRSGSQVLYGGTAANDDLTLEGTSHATKTTSYIILQPTTGNVGIGTTSPNGSLHISAVGGKAISLGTSPLFYAQSTSSFGGMSFGAPTGQNTFIEFLEATTKKAAFGWNAGTNPYNFSIETAGSFELGNVGLSAHYLNVSTAGNIGLGITAPEKILHVRHDGHNGVLIDRANTGLWSGCSWSDAGAINERWFIGQAASTNNFTFRNRSATDVMTIADSGLVADTLYLTAGKVGIRITSSLLGLTHIKQPSTTGAIPVLALEQSDVSEQMMLLKTTIGVGNAIEAVGAKVLTTTHFVKVNIDGVGDRYFPVGTIA